MVMGVSPRDETTRPDLIATRPATIGRARQAFTEAAVDIGDVYSAEYAGRSDSRAIVPFS
jgi:hypothetical protein